jgi:hypothetical protein
MRYLIFLKIVYIFIYHFDSIVAISYNFMPLDGGSLHTTNDNEMNSNQILQGYYQKAEPLLNNITVTVGETVYLNCSFQVSHSIKDDFGLSSTRSFMPTWLKADVLYDQSGFINKFEKEKIIVSRRGVIADVHRHKMDLINTPDRQLQILKLTNVAVEDEGKYICREFSSPYDKLFYLNVLASVNALSMSFSSPGSKYFKFNGRQLGPSSPTVTTSIVTIRENEELVINCTVGSSKPAANVSIWIVPTHRSAGMNSQDNEVKKLETVVFHTEKNSDKTLRSTAIARFFAKAADNMRSVTCIAENYGMDEKWESKRNLNVLFAPKCSEYQKKVYNAGINQTIELECRMTDANPSYLDFTWHFSNSIQNKEQLKSNSFVSRIEWTPKSQLDFGAVTCRASNGLDVAECKLNVILGGPPNVPTDCYYKENNQTIIIECKPGFDQGDPEVYFYLLKKKANGILVEYARKRDSCSFLISNFILEEHFNEFHIYSSNKYGDNKGNAVLISIENKEFLNKNGQSLESLKAEKNRKLTIYALVAFGLLILATFFSCVYFKYRQENENNKRLKNTIDTNHHQYNKHLKRSNDNNNDDTKATISDPYYDPFRYKTQYLTSKDMVKIDAKYNPIKSKENDEKLTMSTDNKSITSNSDDFELMMPDDNYSDDIYDNNNYNIRVNTPMHLFNSDKTGSLKSDKNSKKFKNRKLSSPSQPPLLIQSKFSKQTIEIGSTPS